MAATGTKTFQNFIGGEWVDAVSGETFESINPATGELIGIFPASGAADVVQMKTFATIAQSAGPRRRVSERAGR